jgi:hypothetical protein
LILIHSIDLLFCVHLLRSVESQIAVVSLCDAGVV